MKTSTTQAGNLRPTLGRLAAALAVITVTIGTLSVTPALGDNDRGNNGWHKGQERRGAQYDRRDYRPSYQQPYYYSQPVYAPPPAYYYPQQSPGISFFFPLDLR
jgi:hypothetical protein